MKFLILNTDYPEFLHWLYAQHSGLEEQPYKVQMQVRMESLFGVADFYSDNLRKLGHEAWDVHANNEFAQKAWGREHGLTITEVARVEKWISPLWQHARQIAARTPARHLKPFLPMRLPSLDSQPAWFYDILAAQIKHYKPDVLLNQAMDGIKNSFLKEIKPYMRLLVGQHAATQLPDIEDYTCYDVVTSSSPPTVESFRKKGIPAELHRLGFEPKVLSCLQAEERGFEVTFIGSLQSIHSSRVELLEALSVRFPQLTIWGPRIDHLPPHSPIRKIYNAPAWGRQMYQILGNSKITLNHHGNVPPYANNFRLYEATGVGTLLITDWKANLHEMFEPGKEVVAYHTAEECVELIQYYLQHDDEREAIARAGQERTLRDHTFAHRAEELVDIVSKFI